MSNFCRHHAVSIYKIQEFPWTPFIFFNRIKLILYPSHENSTTGFGVTLSNVSWVMEFLTLAWFYQKNAWPSRKLLYFVIWHTSKYLKLVNFEFSKSILYFKNNFYLISRILFFIHFFRSTKNFKQSHVLLTLNFDVLHFLKFSPIFVGPMLCQFTN